MINELNRYPNKKNDFGNALNMTTFEKDISFLNRYFIYKKIRTVNAEKIANSFISRLPDEIVFEEKNTQIFQKETQKAIEETKPKVKKLNKKIILAASSEPSDENNVSHIIAKEPKEPKEKRINKTRKISSMIKKSTIANPLEFEIIEE